MNVLSWFGVYVVHTFSRRCKWIEVHRPYDRPDYVYLCRGCGRSSEDYK